MFKIKLLFLFLFSFFISNCYAMQQFKVKDGDSVVVNVSKNEMTRLKSGNGKLVKIWGVKGILDVQPDKKTGEAYIKPTKSSPDNFSFFVRDSNGSTYTIIARKLEIPSETIVLNGSDTSLTKGELREYKASSYKVKIKGLMKAMMLDKDLEGYATSNVNKNIPLWAQTDINIVKTYSGQDFLGEVYTLKNTTKKVLNFKETEFMNFGDNVRAISMRKLSLESGEITFLFIVRSIGG